MPAPACPLSQHACPQHPCPHPHPQGWAGTAPRAQAAPTKQSQSSQNLPGSQGGEEAAELPAPLPELQAPWASPRFLPDPIITPRNSAQSTMAPASRDLPEVGRSLPPLLRLSGFLGPSWLPLDPNTSPECCSQSPVRPKLRLWPSPNPHQHAFALLLLGEARSSCGQSSPTLPGGPAPGEEPSQLLG